MRLINAGFNTRYIDKEGKTASMWAFDNDMIDVAMKLANPPSFLKNETMCTRNEKREEAVKNVEKYQLINACKSRNKDEAMRLINAGFNACHIDKEGRTALLWACENIMTDIAMKLLDIDCNHSHEDKHYNTPILIACKKSMTNVAMKLLDKGGNQCFAETTGDTNYTPLMYACENKLPDVAMRILDVDDCAPDILSGGNNDTALILACKNNMNDVAEKILNMGDECAIPYTINSLGETALFWARRNNMEIADDLERLVFYHQERGA